MNDITAQAILAAAAAEDAAQGVPHAGPAGDNASLAPAASVATTDVPAGTTEALMPAPGPAAEPTPARLSGPVRRRKAQDEQAAGDDRAHADDAAADGAGIASATAVGDWGPSPAASELLAQATTPSGAAAAPAPAGASGPDTATSAPGLVEVLLGAVPVALLAAAAGSDTSAAPAPQDTTPPSVSVDVPDRSRSATPTITGTTDLADGDTVALTLRLADGSTRDYAVKVQGGMFSLRMPTALPEGSYTVTATAVDAAGNRASASDTGTVDLMTIDGSITAGPVVAGHGLTVTAFAADGSQLGSATVAADGSYRIVLQQPYTGLLLVRVADTNSAADYRDEASGQPQDLTVDLRAVARADGAQDLRVNVTPATELVVLGLGLAAGDGGSAAARLGELGTAQVAAAQVAVQSALGLPDDFVSATVVATVRPDGSVNPQANLYGQVLAAVSGMSMTQGLTVGQVLEQLGVEASDGQLGRTAEVDLVGAARVADADAEAVAVGLGWSGADAAALVSAWSAVVAAANGNGTPTAQDLRVLGVEGADSTLAIGLLTSALAGREVGSVGSVKSLTAVARAADNVVAAASGEGELRLEDLQQLGISGVSAQSLGALEHALATLGTAALADGIEGIESIAARVVADATAPVLTVSSRVVTDGGALADIEAGGITRDSTVSLAGTASDSSGTVRIEVFEGSTRLGSTSPDSQGRWAFDVPALTDGLHALTVRATDLAGNVTQVSAPAFTIDTTRPVITSAAVARADEHQSTLYVGSASDASPSGGGLTWSVGGADAALLQVDALGRVSLRTGALDFETRPVYRFDLSVTDSAGNTASLAVTVNVADLNDESVVSVGTGAVVEDATPAASGTLSASDEDNPALAFVAGTVAGTYGSLNVDAAGAWTYTLGSAAQALAGGQVVTDVITVPLNDGGSTTVTITVTGTDDAPVVSGGAGAVTEGASPSVSGTLTASDVDNPAPTFVAGTVTGAYGSLTVDAAGAWTYTLGPAAQALVSGQVVSDPITVALSDGTSTTVTITVNGAGGSTVVSTGTGAVTEDTAPTVSGVLTATDAANPSLAFVAGTVAGSYGVLNVDAAGAWTYTLGSAAQALAGGQVVTDVITVPLNDGGSTTVTITVTGTDDAPVVGVGSGAVTEDTAPTASGTLSAADEDNPALAFVAGTVAGTYGSLNVDAAGAWTYTLGSAAQALAGGQVVTDVITVPLNDGGSTTVTITVTGNNDAPVIVTGTALLVEDSTPTASGTFVATDVDGPPPVFVAGETSTVYGRLLTQTDGSWAYTLGDAAQALAAGQVVTDTLLVELTSGDYTIFNIQITGSNDAPVAADDRTTVMEVGALLSAQGGVGNVISGEDGSGEGRDVDPDTLDLLTIATVRTGSEAGTGTAGVVNAVDSEGTPLAGLYGSLTMFIDGSYRYDLDNSLAAVQALGVGAIVTDTFTYTVSDGQGATDTATLTVQIMGAADAPVLSTVTGTAVESGGTANSQPGADATGNVLATATDPDSHPDSLSVTTFGALDAALAATGTATAGQTLAGLYGSLVVQSDGSYRYVVDDADPLVQALLPGDTLVDHFTYTVTDGDGATSTARLDVTIQGAEDAVSLTRTGSASVAYPVGSGHLALFPGNPGIAVDFVDRTTGDGANTPDQFTAAFTIVSGRQAGDLLSLQFATGQEALAAATHAAWDPITGSLMVTVDAAPGLDLASVYPQVFAALNFSTTDTSVGSTRQVQVDLDDGRGQTSPSVVLDLTLAGGSAPTIVVGGSGSTPENQAYTAALSYSNATGPVTWALAGGDDAAYFSIDASGNLTLGARDFEIPADAGLDNTYRVLVQASDAAGHVQTQEVAVTVTNVEDVTTSIAFGSPAFTGTEDTTMSFTGASLMSLGTFVDDGGVSLAALRLSSVTGTLTINGAAYSASSNFTVTPDSEVTWRPASQVNGSSVLMFNAVAVASDGQLSDATGVRASVAAVPDASTVLFFGLPNPYDVATGGFQSMLASSVADPDGTPTQVVYRIVGNYSPSLGDAMQVDELDFSNVNATRFDHVWDATTGTLTITQAEGQTANFAQWNDYLRFVQFATSDPSALVGYDENGDPIQDSRTFQMTMTSGPDNEVRSSSTVTVNFIGNSTMGALAGSPDEGPLAAAGGDAGDAQSAPDISPSLLDVYRWQQPDHASTLNFA